MSRWYELAVQRRLQNRIMNDDADKRDRRHPDYDDGCPACGGDECDGRCGG